MGKRCPTCNYEAPIGPQGYDAECPRCGKPYPAPEPALALPPIVLKEVGAPAAPAILRTDGRLTRKIVLYLGGTITVAALLVLFARWSDDHERGARAQRAAEIAKMSVGMQLATLEGVSTDSASVARIDYLVGQLADRFGMNRSLIGDMTLVAQQSLRKNGVRESIISILESMNLGTLHRGIDDAYKEYVASYIVMRSNGIAPPDAVAALQILGRSGGVHRIMPAR